MGRVTREDYKLGVMLLVGICALRSYGGTVTGTFEPVATGSNVDLTIIGKMDCVHWGLQTDSSISRKEGVTPLISDFSVLGTGVVYPYQFSDNANGYTWYDGSPILT